MPRATSSAQDSRSPRPSRRLRGSLCIAALICPLPTSLLSTFKTHLMITSSKKPPFPFHPPPFHTVRGHPASSVLLPAAQLCPPHVPHDSQHMCLSPNNPKPLQAMARPPRVPHPGLGGGGDKQEPPRAASLTAQQQDCKPMKASDTNLSWKLPHHHVSTHLAPELPRIDAGGTLAAQWLSLAHRGVC